MSGPKHESEIRMERDKEDSNHPDILGLRFLTTAPSSGRDNTALVALLCLLSNVVPSLRLRENIAILLRVKTLVLKVKMRKPATATTATTTTTTNHGSHQHFTITNSSPTVPLLSFNVQFYRHLLQLLMSLAYFPGLAETIAAFLLDTRLHETFHYYATCHDTIDSVSQALFLHLVSHIINHVHSMSVRPPPPPPLSPSSSSSSSLVAVAWTAWTHEALLPSLVSLVRARYTVPDSFREKKIVLAALDCIHAISKKQAHLDDPPLTGRDGALYQKVFSHEQTPHHVQNMKKTRTKRTMKVDTTNAATSFQKTSSRLDKCTSVPAVAAHAANDAWKRLRPHPPPPPPHLVQHDSILVGRRLVHDRDARLRARGYTLLRPFMSWSPSCHPTVDEHDDEEHGINNVNDDATTTAAARLDDTTTATATRVDDMGEEEARMIYQFAYDTLSDPSESAAVRTEACVFLTRALGRRSRKSQNGMTKWPLCVSLQACTRHLCASFFHSRDDATPTTNDSYMENTPQRTKTTAITSSSVTTTTTMKEDRSFERGMCSSALLLAVIMLLEQLRLRANIEMEHTEDSVAHLHLEVLTSLSFHQRLYRENSTIASGLRFNHHTSSSSLHRQPLTHVDAAAVVALQRKRWQDHHLRWTMHCIRKCLHHDWNDRRRRSMHLDPLCHYMTASAMTLSQDIETLGKNMMDIFNLCLKISLDDDTNDDFYDDDAHGHTKPPVYEYPTQQQRNTVSPSSLSVLLCSSFVSVKDTSPSWNLAVLMSDAMTFFYHLCRPCLDNHVHSLRHPQTLVFPSHDVTEQDQDHVAMIQTKRLLPSLLAMTCFPRESSRLTLLLIPACHVIRTVSIKR